MLKDFLLRLANLWVYGSGMGSSEWYTANTLTLPSELHGGFLAWALPIALRFGSLEQSSIAHIPVLACSYSSGSCCYSHLFACANFDFTHTFSNRFWVHTSICPISRKGPLVLRWIDLELPVISYPRSIEIPPKRNLGLLKSILYIYTVSYYTCLLDVYCGPIWVYFILGWWDYRSIPKLYSHEIPFCLINKPLLPQFLTHIIAFPVLW